MHGTHQSLQAAKTGTIILFSPTVTLFNQLLIRIFFIWENLYSTEMIGWNAKSSVR